MPNQQSSPTRASWLAMLVVLALFGIARSSLAQVGTVSPQPYPGWAPSDRVLPTISVDVAYDRSTAMWRYTYTLANGAGAEQDIEKLRLGISGAPATLGSPEGWTPLSGFLGAADSAPAAAPAGVVFLANLSDEEYSGDVYPSSPHQIRPGASVSGLVIESPYGPGTTRAYVQGYAAIPFPPSGEDDYQAYEGSSPEPEDTLNAQRRWTLGPAFYATVVTDGNRRGTVDGFLGFMNLRESGSVLGDPAVVALKFSLNGEAVDRETFRATLNGVDITAAFFPGGPGSADLVAVLRPDSSPLQVGKNVLITSVDGTVPGTARQASDTDRMVFEVQP